MSSASLNCSIHSDLFIIRVKANSCTEDDKITLQTDMKGKVLRSYTLDLTAQVTKLSKDKLLPVGWSFQARLATLSVTQRVTLQLSEPSLNFLQLLWGQGRLSLTLFARVGWNIVARGCLCSWNRVT